ncbi:D-alanyl-D-alanine carboxypeptidase family protein [Methylocella silvestris]|uniref:serine-type D-Ala-D-Ala carboxypeptidase n=1 Tax=Methylocella silvestris TaxID=199596 RepID=A0A2J7TDK7_METSI|nr:D-alanyl-D-alanine carboxypeptidase [Methylocella silvestris]
MIVRLPPLRIIRLIALAILAGPCFGLEPASAQTIQTSVPHAILIDVETGSVLFEKDADAPVTPASTVKVMTADVVFGELAQGRIKLDDEFTISEHAWRTGGAPARASSMFAALNSRVRVEDLIRGLVIDSGNDAAIALAEGVAGSESGFAGLMMKRGHELGLTRSVFTNPWGKDDPEQKVTPREMTVLAAHLIATYPDYYKYFGEKEFTWNKIRQTNRNPLLTMDIGADGLKTGNIDASGFGLVGSAVQNGQRLILALYGAASAKERAEEARKLFLWAFRSFSSKSLFSAEETIGYAKVYGGASFEAPLIAGREVKALVPRVGGEKFTGRIVYNGPLIAPVEAGKEVARLKIFRGSVEVLDLPLKTQEAVEVGSLPRRAMGAGLEYVGGLFRKYVGSKIDSKYVATQ